MTGIVYRNLLLAHLNEADRHLLEPLEPVDLHQRDCREQPGQPISHIYFPETAMGSVVMAGGPETKVEMGVVAREGMTGLPLLYGDDQSVMETFVQIPGRLLRMPVGVFQNAIGASSTLKDYFLRYARTFHHHVASTATANAAGSIEQRLARWLLMCHDRVGDHIHLSHEFLAIMLGNRRASITDAIHKLEGRGMIRSLRMDLEIRDRSALEALCGGLYGVAEAEYLRIMGFPIDGRPQLIG